MIKFTQITDKLKYPPKLKGKLSTIHSDIITYVISNFHNTTKFKSKVIAVLNTVSYYIISGDSLPSDWDSSSPLDNLESIDSAVCESTIGELYLHVKSITWDVQESATPVFSAEKIDTTSSEIVSKTATVKQSSDYLISATPKEHLYIRPPVVPQFDTSKPWLQSNVNQTVYTIYRSLPLIPANQSQISVTTDSSIMTATDIMKLYPNCFIRTRASLMYEAYGSLTLDPDVGILIPITGFSPAQVKDNIIKYPHIYKLLRYVDDTYVSFYSDIEIDGKLYKTLDVWDTLPDSKKMPRNSDYIKEYVVRRYLLERDIKGIKHKYPLYGSLDAFLTLFTTSDDYIRLGYVDVLDIAKQCVQSRINYKRSRNPILKAVYNNQ